jgi:hypothetical protein
MLKGGVPEKDAIGTFSYWLDCRGIELRQFYPGCHFPKPIFNVGLDVALFDQPELHNFGVMGRSAGYSPLGQGAGRIVQHNAMLGEALGIAAAIAVKNQVSLNTIGAHDIRLELNSRKGSEIQVSGQGVLSQCNSVTLKLLQKDNACLVH